MTSFARGDKIKLDDLLERMNDLEVRFTHQTRLLDELNEVVADYSLQIDRLSRENQRMREMMKNFAPSLEESPDE